MQKLLKLIFIIIIISAAGIIFSQKTDISEIQEYYRQIRPCRVPLKYSVGEVDAEFNISQDELVLISKEAENIWEAASGRNLLEYDLNSELKINLVYDQRQIITNEAEKISENLDDLKLSHDAMAKQYQSIQSDYSRKTKDYEKALADYQDRLKKYNGEVEYWNEKGGAPEDEYENLLDEKKKLKAIFDSLEKKRAEINKLAGKTNDLATKDQGIISQYNANITTYNKLFGGSREFEKGAFSKNAINIYQFKQKSDLRLTLAHELGHALNFGHIENPQSIMYYLIGEQNLDSPAPTPEDMAEIERICN